jgi:hypothetical protein
MYDPTRITHTECPLRTPLHQERPAEGIKRGLAWNRRCAGTYWEGKLAFEPIRPGHHAKVLEHGKRGARHGSIAVSDAVWLISGTTDTIRHHRTDSVRRCKKGLPNSDPFHTQCKHSRRRFCWSPGFRDRPWEQIIIQHPIRRDTNGMREHTHVPFSYTSQAFRD